VDGGGDKPHMNIHKKLEPSDVILSSFHAEKFTFLTQNFFFGKKKMWTFLPI